MEWKVSRNILYPGSPNVSDTERDRVMGEGSDLVLHLRSSTGYVTSYSNLFERREFLRCRRTDRQNRPIVRKKVKLVRNHPGGGLTSRSPGTLPVRNASSSSRNSSASRAANHTMYFDSISQVSSGPNDRVRKSTRLSKRHSSPVDLGMLQPQQKMPSVSEVVVSPDPFLR